MYKTLFTDVTKKWVCFNCIIATHFIYILNCSYIHVNYVWDTPVFSYYCECEIISEHRDNFVLVLAIYKTD